MFNEEHRVDDGQVAIIANATAESELKHPTGKDWYLLNEFQAHV